MVKRLKQIIINVLLIYVFCPAVCGVLGGCTVDLSGFFISGDLDKRLEKKDNFIFLSDEDLSPSFGSEYSFIVLADIHIENGNAWGFENMADIIAGNSEIKFIAVLGDITQSGYAEDLEKFREIAGTFNVPCYPVIGNHDIYFGNWSVWNEIIGSTSYRVDAADTTLFILDSANSFFGRQQLDWLEKEISKTDGRVFIFTHSPLFVTGPAEMQQMTDLRERARIVSMLRGKCDIIFSGHSHARYTYEINNTEYIVIEDFKNNKVYCFVTVNKNGVSREFKKL